MVVLAPRFPAFRLSRRSQMAAKKKSMSAEHKAALAAGREQGRAIRAYLEALDAHQPKRGRRRTAESIEKRLAEIDKKLGTADAMTRVSLIQERLNLTDELASMDAGDNLEELEAGFVQHAAEYSERKGLSYTAWREVGVPAATLKAAGISRSA
jgi:hypothetical protein